MAVLTSAQMAKAIVDSLKDQRKYGLTIQIWLKIYGQKFQEEIEALLAGNKGQGDTGGALADQSYGEK